MINNLPKQKMLGCCSALCSEIKKDHHCAFDSFIFYQRRHCVGGMTEQPQQVYNALRTRDLEKLALKEFFISILILFYA